MCTSWNCSQDFGHLNTRTELDKSVDHQKFIDNHELLHIKDLFIETNMDVYQLDSRSITI